MCTAKTQKHHFSFIILSTIIPNDTRIHGQNAQWSVILDKCTEISSKYRQSPLFFNALSFVLISHHFKPLTKIRTKLIKNKLRLKQPKN